MAQQHSLSMLSKDLSDTINRVRGKYGNGLRLVSNAESIKSAEQDVEKTARLLMRGDDDTTHDDWKTVLQRYEDAWYEQLKKMAQASADGRQ